MEIRSRSIRRQAKELADISTARLKELLGLRADLDTEIIHLKEVLKGLRPILDANYSPEGTGKELGIKKACINILQIAYEPLTATEIVKELKEIGFAVDDYKKPLAVISTTMKRLIADKKAVPVEKNGKTAYKWIGSENGELMFD